MKTPISTMAVPAGAIQDVAAERVAEKMALQKS